MFVIGVAFLPPHSLVAAVDGARYRLYYLAGDNNVEAIGTALRQFLTAESHLSPVVMVNKATTLVQYSQIFRHYSRRVYAILVCDSVTELLAHRIPLLDGSRTETGWWRKPGVIADIVGTGLAAHHHTLRLSRLHRRTVNATVNHQTRGVLAKVAAVVSAAVPGPKRTARLIRHLLGWLIGTVSAVDYRAAVSTLRDTYNVSAALFDELDRYHRSPKGTALHRVFYRMQQGDDFRELQIRYTRLDMDDWLTVTEVYIPTEKYKCTPPRR